MRIIHRGFRSFRRNWARNLVVVVLLFVCLTFSMSMLAVRLAADSQVDSIKKTVGNYGEIKVSSSYTMKRFESERQKSQAERAAEARSMTEEEAEANRVETLVPEELADKLSEDGHIVTYDKVLETQVVVPGITNTNMQQMFQMREGGPAEMNAGRSGSRMNQNSFSFAGNMNGASSSDFTMGAKKLVSGKMFTYKDHADANPVVVVEKNLASDNELEVGDTLEASVSGGTGSARTLELTVVGIYETVEAESSQGSGGNSNQQQMFNPAGNKFYAPLSVVQALTGTGGYVQLGSYYFDTVDSTAAVKADFSKVTKGTDGKYEFATDLSDYQSIADPLLKARNTSVIGLGGALGACALIILLSMVIIVSGRTRELGVLKAIGSTNGQVIGQFAVEVVCICLVAIVFAMGVTAVIGQTMGNWLLPDVGAKTTAQSNTQGAPGAPGMPGGGGGPFGQDSLYKEGGRGVVTAQEDTPAAKIDVVYRGSLFLYGVLILLGISLAGIAIPLFWITRLRPARVLSME